MIYYLNAMFLTAVIETIVLWCCRYRGWKVLSYFFVLNLVSNFLVNFAYRHTYYMLPKTMLVPLLEFSVYLFEVGFLGILLGYNKKLFSCVLLSNLISYSLGVLLYGF